jgi:alpha-L-rhamnosidase
MLPDPFRASRGEPGIRRQFGIKRFLAASVFASSDLIMKRITRPLILGLMLLTGVCFADVEPKNLRCEYLINPLGIDAPQPRLSWILDSARRGEKQTAYQVLVASTLKLLEQDQGDLWDSGKVASDETAHVGYAGRPLTSRQSCFWKVRAWDRDGKPGDWSPVAQWHMGLLQPTWRRW